MSESIECTEGAVVRTLSGRRVAGEGQILAGREGLGPLVRSRRAGPRSRPPHIGSPARVCTCARDAQRPNSAARCAGGSVDGGRGSIADLLAACSSVASRAPSSG